MKERLQGKRTPKKIQCSSQQGLTMFLMQCSVTGVLDRILSFAGVPGWNLPRREGGHCLARSARTARSFHEAHTRLVGLTRWLIIADRQPARRWRRIALNGIFQIAVSHACRRSVLNQSLEGLGWLLVAQRDKLVSFQTVSLVRKFHTEQMFVLLGKQSCATMQTHNQWSDSSGERAICDIYTILNLECCKSARIRFHCASALVVPRVCAP